MVTLPEIKQMAIVPEYFPTVMQAVIFRNWGMVPKEKIAEVLSCSVKEVEEEAFRMGLSPQKDVSLWAEKGYITIIRANWHLLPYEQLLTLLGWTEEQLSITLKEEDFLDIKLGNFKPECETVSYRALTDNEKAQTENIKTVLQKYCADSSDAKAPFDFFGDLEEKPVKKAPFDGCVTVDGSWCVKNLTGDSVVSLMVEDFSKEVKSVWDISLASDSQKQIVLSYLSGKKAEYHEISITSEKIEIHAADSAGILRGLNRLLDLSMKAGGLYFMPGNFVREPRFGVRYIYSFCGLYQTAFDVDSATYCPDSLLKMYSKVGVNGIWLQGVLYRLTEFPFAPELSDGWQERLKNLQNFAKRAARYGIKIYLYLNEPRTMPLAFFDKYPEMKGAVSGRYACMCTSAPKTREYLSNAVEFLCRSVPELGGFFTITMSENLTHCKSRGEIDIPCERCKDREPWELVQDFNSILEEASHKVNPGITTIAWDWAWSQSFGFDEEALKKAIEALPKSMALQCKRETKIPFVRGGVKGEVDDYALSVEGVSEESLKRWKLAKQSGHPISAKLQLNNSWECSTTSYLPVYEILMNQMNSMIEANVDHLMLSWTLGGYPSPNIRLVSEAFFVENGKKEPDYYGALEVLYGEHAPVVKEATDLFCKAFREFPFHIEVLYQGPQNAGVSNPLYSAPTGYTSTMTCYAYDDLKNWCGNFPEEILEQQFQKVSDIWAEGLSVLEKMGECELKDVSYVSYSLFLSSYHQIRFIRLRDMLSKEDSPALRAEICALIARERDLAVKVYEIMLRRPEIGFEAANHYYYSADTVKEKIVNCEYLMKLYQ